MFWLVDYEIMLIKLLCAAHHPNINAAVELLRQGIFLLLLLPVCLFIFFFNLLLNFYVFSPYHQGIAELDIEPYVEDEGTGDLRYVQVNCL